MKPASNPDIDKGRQADWGKTAQDYARHRPGPPDSFYTHLLAAGIGLKDQAILDIGTGSGVLARQFAGQGSRVTASDISEEQVAMARELARAQGLDIDWAVCRASELPYGDDQFDIVTACQCWWYFDHAKALAEIRRVLKPGGRLVICAFSFLPTEDAVVAASEKLVLKYNPDWSGAGWDGRVPIFPEGRPEDDYLVDMFVYDEAIPFTHESWRGRMRALRGIGATLDAAAIAAFDAEHQELLKALTPDPFTVLHRIDAHIYQFDEE